MCTVPNRTELATIWAKSWLLLSFYRWSRWKERSVMGALPSCFPEGAAGVQVAAGVIESGRTAEEILTRHPSIVPSETGRAVGSVPRLPGLGNGYLWATGKVSHLRITHSQEALREERAQTGRERQWESGCPFMLFRSWGKEAEMWLESRGERKWHVFGAVVCFGQLYPQTLLLP